MREILGQGVQKLMGDNFKLGGFSVMKKEQGANTHPCLKLKRGGGQQYSIK
jgi:hypothetical protein